MRLCPRMCFRTDDRLMVFVSVDGCLWGTTRSVAIMVEVRLFEYLLLVFPIHIADGPQRMDEIRRLVS